MKLTGEQIAALSAPLNRDNVKTRSQSGRELSYIEGWHAIAEANRIFGFDAWHRELRELTMVVDTMRDASSGNHKNHYVAYRAVVRVTVGTIVREGVGYGEGIDKFHGQAHESAIKEAETDAMKRALMTFGNQFGLALYDKTQSNVVDAKALMDQAAAYIRTLSATKDDVAKLKSLSVEWWTVALDAKAAGIKDVESLIAYAEANR